MRVARVSPWFLVAFYFVFSCGELCFLPVGISFVSQTAPARLASMLMGVWLTANFFASLIGGYLAGMVQRIERGEVFHDPGRSGRLLPDLRRMSCWLCRILPPGAAGDRRSGGCS